MSPVRAILLQVRVSRYTDNGQFCHRPGAETHSMATGRLYPDMQAISTELSQSESSMCEAGA